ncbi:uncharacterized protein MONBRDRAFT_28371 [Monosiga brevicollis MX1]|uniref:Uncharacterized protein n=1 Tax=Monosiga brevicollis TaxID=81824 RepID=A9V7Z5_MONBE|nr:uncharacterized protein MONBRDRAFT_28371 [Monosiga brevicollis MX1]EDQ86461.1 predicted protein [Monosiga brevicollis MX1]|eukprot:XP_001748851.1 hypothetical protein [Monosiga brevicollis MX1]
MAARLMARVAALRQASLPAGYTTSAGAQGAGRHLAGRLLSSDDSDRAYRENVVDTNTLEFDEATHIRLTTRDSIRGRKVQEELGVVVGTAARSKSFITDLIQRFRGIIGGQLMDYEELFANTTAEATHNAMIHAQRLGATAIVRVRYESAATDSNTTGVSCFVICFGTAVRDMPDPNEPGVQAPLPQISPVHRPKDDAA